MEDKAAPEGASSAAEGTPKASPAPPAGGVAAPKAPAPPPLAAAATAPAGATRQKRRMSEKRVKLLGLVAVVAVLVVILLWGMVPDKILEVREVVGDATGMDGDEVSVKGIVTVWESQSSNFTLQDSNNPALVIHVVHSGAIPEGFGLNVTAVVKGTFHVDGGSYRIESKDIQIGCPSKY